VARLDDDTPANVALQLHINVSLNRPPDRTWRRPPGRVHGTSGSTSYESIPPVPLETTGGVLSTVDMVVQRRDGPRRLRDNDDDDDGGRGQMSAHDVLRVERRRQWHVTRRRRRRDDDGGDDDGDDDDGGSGDDDGDDDTTTAATTTATASVEGRWSDRHRRRLTTSRTLSISASTTRQYITRQQAVGPVQYSRVGMVTGHLVVAAIAVLNNNFPRTVKTYHIRYGNRKLTALSLLQLRKHDNVAVGQFVSIS